MGSWGRLLQAQAVQPEGSPRDRPSSPKPQPDLKYDGTKDHARPLAPGVTFLGDNPRSTLVRLAQLEGIDVLAMFQVRVKRVASRERIEPGRRSAGAKYAYRRSPRNRYSVKEVVHNDTQLVLIDVATGRTLYETQTLNNIAVAHEREDPLTPDPVTEAAAALVGYVDENLAMQDLPQGLTAEHVSYRVDLLPDGRGGAPLAALAELRFYHDRGLLDAAAWREACQRILGGEEGRRLAEGDAEQKAKVLAQWLPRDAVYEVSSL
jgi:hypothetical protein